MSLLQRVSSPTFAGRPEELLTLPATLGGCVEVGADVLPLAPFVEFLSDLAERYGTSTVRELAGPTGDELGRLLPAQLAVMRTSASCSPPPASASRQRPAASSKAAASTSLSKRMCRSTSKSRATSRRY